MQGDSRSGALGLRVEVSQDEMQAFLYIEGLEGGCYPSFGQAMEALRGSGVVFGIDEGEVRKLLASPVPGGYREVARGIAPVNGTEAVIRWDVELTSIARPAETVDGHVDYRNLNVVQSVTQGQVLCQKTPATKGSPGMTVTGRNVEPKAGKDTPLPLSGKNVAVDGTGLKLLAGCSGHVVLNGNRLSVVRVYEISRDVDFSTGDIDFLGTVLIRGSVRPGFSVRAEEDIEVEGYVDCGFLSAGRNVTVRNGVQGGGKGNVDAAGTVKARFIENARVKAGKDIAVNDYIMHSHVTAGSKVQVTGSKGTIVGGLLRAGQEVSATIIGSELAAATRIEVGVSPELREELLTTASALLRSEKDLEHARAATNILKEIEQSGKLVDTEKKEALLRVIRNRFRLEGEREALLQRKVELEEELAACRNGRVRASETIFPGVKVTVGQASYAVIDELSRVSLTVDPEGEIVLGPY